jgi:hypothetical protein
MANKVLKTSNSRVFLLEGRAGPTAAPAYQSCFRMTGLSQGFGDIERVECPDPYNYGTFIEVAQIKGASERVTTTLEGRYYMDLLSTMLSLANNGCAFDVQLHLGSCGDPSVFDTFTKTIVLEEAYVTNYGTEDLGALQSDDNAVVNETVDISATRVYEIRPLLFSAVAASTITNEVVDITLGDSKACAGDDCGDVSDGCTTFYAVTKAAGGSSGTPADVVKIAGTTIVARDIDTLTAVQDPTGIAIVGNYVVVTAAGTASSYNYALKSQFTTTTVPTWTEVSVAQAPNDIFSLGNVAFIVSDGGYIYKMTSPTGTLTTLNAGSATTQNLQAVHALDDSYIVAVGAAGAVVYSQDGSNFSVATVPAATTLNCVYMISKKIWWVGGANGNLYYTEDSGTTWTAKSFTGSGAGSVTAIEFSTQSVGYMAHKTAGTKGYLFRTYNGGYTWNMLPEGSGTITASDQFNAIATCKLDPNIIMAGGLDDGGSDGLIVKGVAS